jgi:hypothetical protein
MNRKITLKLVDDSGYAVDVPECEDYTSTEHRLNNVLSREMERIRERIDFYGDDKSQNGDKFDFLRHLQAFKFGEPLTADNNNEKEVF